MPIISDDEFRNSGLKEDDRSVFEVVNEVFQELGDQIDRVKDKTGKRTGCRITGMAEFKRQCDFIEKKIIQLERMNSKNSNVAAKEFLERFSAAKILYFDEIKKLEKENREFEHEQKGNR